MSTPRAALGFAESRPGRSLSPAKVSGDDLPRQSTRPPGDRKTQPGRRCLASEPTPFFMRATSRIRHSADNRGFSRLFPGNGKAQHRPTLARPDFPAKIFPRTGHRESGGPRPGRIPSVSAEKRATLRQFCARGPNLSRARARTLSSTSRSSSESRGSASIRSKTFMAPQWAILCPPSMYIVSPVMKGSSSENSAATSRATSSGLPGRPKGMRGSR